jgi:hypothetical protein
MNYTQLAVLIEKCYEHVQRLKADGTHDKLVESDRLGNELSQNPDVHAFQMLFMSQPQQMSAPEPRHLQAV